MLVRSSARGEVGRSTSTEGVDGLGVTTEELAEAEWPLTTRQQKWLGSPW